MADAADVTIAARARNERGQFLKGRRSGAPRGNLNGVKNPWIAFWRRRALRPEDRWALRLVTDYVPSLIADKGGAEHVSYAEQREMELAAVARVCWALGMHYGNLDVVARFVGLESKILSALGLSRRAKEIDPMQALREAARRAGEEESE